MTEKKQTTVELEDGTEVVIEHPPEWSESRIKNYAVLNAPKKYTGALDDETDEISNTTLAMAGVLDRATAFVPDPFFTGSVMSTGPEIDQAREQFIRKTLGIPLDQELSLGEETVRALGDPMNLVGIGRTGAKSIFGKLAGTLGQTGEAVATTAASTAGARSARDATGIPAVDETLSALLGTVGGSSTALATSAGRVTLGAPLKLVEEGVAVARDAKADGSATQQSVSAKTNAVSEYLAEKRIQAHLNTIAESSSPGEIAEAARRASEIAESVPGLNLEGLAGALYGNTAVQNMMRNVAQHDPTFVENIKRNAQSNLDVLVDRLGEVTGIAGRVDETDLYNVANDIFEKQRQALDKEFEDKQDSFRRQMAEVNNRLSALSPTRVGEMATALATKVEIDLRGQVGRLYDAAKVSAKGIDLPEEVTSSLSKLAKSLKKEDPFGPESFTAKKLKSRWSPKTVKKEVFPGIEMDSVEIPKVPLQEIASLKKAINRDLSAQYKRFYSDPTAPAKVYRLLELQKQVNGAIDNLGQDPQFSPFVDKLREADAFYFEKLGLPMKAEGMLRINNTQFDKDVAYHLVNDTQKATDYINFVGETEGKAVLRHALRMQAEKKVFTNGSIDRQKLRNFLSNKTNQELIQLADMGAEFANLEQTASTILGTMERHKKAYDEQVKELSNGFFKSILNKNVNAAVREMINNPRRRKQILAEINKLDPSNRDMLLAGIRNSYITEGMLKSTKPLKQYFEDNLAASVDFFGKDYLKDLDTFAAAFDIVTDIDKALIKTIGTDTTLDLMKQYAGISADQAIGLMRNQILSTPRKFINAGSVMLLSKAQQRYYKKAAEILQDPEVIKKLANPPEETMAKTKEVLKFLKAGGEAGAEAWTGTVVPYYVEVLNAAGIFSQARVASAVNTEQEQERYRQQLQAQ